VARESLAPARESIRPQRLPSFDYYAGPPTFNRGDSADSLLEVGSPFGRGIAEVRPSAPNPTRGGLRNAVVRRFGYERMEEGKHQFALAHSRREERLQPLAEIGRRTCTCEPFEIEAAQIGFVDSLGQADDCAG
jgi:hypothetical protein